MKKQVLIVNTLLTVMVILFTLSVLGQFAPPPGDESSTAIHADSSIINNWAGQVTVERGLLNAADTSMGKVTHGSASNATGEADHQVVSLGDGGTATYALETPLTDGEGFDFAVYENSFSDDFLELAFVEVSSGGEHFIRFPSVSITQTDQQVGPFETIDATELYNLAGKYRALFGSPFDLAELADSAGVNISEVTHIRIRDVVGSLDDAIATYDSEGNKVNDPWPTDIASGGFDLDAVALINLQGESHSISELTTKTGVYPNPVTDRLTVAHSGQVERVSLISAQGEVLYSVSHPDRKHKIDMSTLQRGVYLIKILAEGKSITKKVVKK